MDKKRDKYDEIGAVLISLFKKSPFPPTLEEVVVFLRSAFPPPAENARQCVDRLRECKPWEQTGSDFDEYELDRQEAAAEIESFAQSRVEPWREALASMIEYAEFVYGSVLVKDVQFANKTFNEISDDIGRVRALLSDFPAKEATK